MSAVKPLNTKTPNIYSRASNGFTLLELLIALSISMMLILSISFSYRQMVFTLQRTSQQLDMNNQKITVMKFLNARLKNIKYPNTEQVKFFGDSNKVTFIGDPVRSALINATIKYSIYFDAVTNSIMVDTFDMEDNHIDSAMLLENVEQFTLNYFGTTNPDLTENLWHVQWMNDLYPPLLIKVSIKQFNNDLWPDIYIANKLTPMSQVNTIQSNQNEK